MLFLWWIGEVETRAIRYLKHRLKQAIQFFNTVDENKFQILSVEDMTFKTSPPFLHRIIRILFERNDQNFVTNVRSTCWFWCLVLRIFDYLVSGWDNKKRLKRDLRVFPRISMRRTDLGLFTIRVSHASIREKI